MFDFEALTDEIAGKTVLCVGDLMLDEFVYGEVSRVSPEAPAPVIAVQRSETNIGGAGIRHGRPRERCASSPNISPPICCARIGNWHDRRRPKPSRN
jgi:hypothetical protein